MSMPERSSIERKDPSGGGIQLRFSHPRLKLSTSIVERASSLRSAIRTSGTIPGCHAFLRRARNGACGRCPSTSTPCRLDGPPRQPARPGRRSARARRRGPPVSASFRGGIEPCRSCSLSVGWVGDRWRLEPTTIDLVLQSVVVIGILLASPDELAAHVVGGGSVGPSVERRIIWHLPSFRVKDQSFKAVTKTPEISSMRSVAEAQASSASVKAGHSPRETIRRAVGDPRPAHIPSLPAEQRSCV